jgi:ATP/maltotriose-dependent transcriptional regulator MalT
MLARDASGRMFVQPAAVDEPPLPRVVVDEPRKPPLSPSKSVATNGCAAIPMGFVGGTNGARQVVLALGSNQRGVSGKSARSVRGIVERAWRATLALQTDEAVRLIVLAERNISDLAPDLSNEIREEIGVLRAVSLALQDESFGALSLALSFATDGRPHPTRRIVSTICRLGYWKLGDFKSVYAIARRPPGAIITKRQALPAIFDLSIDAAVEIDQLRFPVAKRLAFDALALAEEFVGRDSAAAALPASLIAQVLYEEGYLSDAESLINNRLSAIGAAGHIECAIRAYTILARIASDRVQVDFATMILREAECLGERRDWPRLIAASIAERLDLMLRHGRIGEAELFAERLHRLAIYCQSKGAFAQYEIQRHAALGSCRVALAKGPSPNAVAVLRQLQFEAASRKDLYLGLQLGIRLVDALTVIGKEKEAAGILLDALKLGAAVGLYQGFVDCGARIGLLLGRLYERGRAPGDDVGEILPYVGSLLERHIARVASPGTLKPPARPSSYLSERERNILQLISQGLSNKRIAKELAIAPETVKSHVKHIFAKLAVGTRAEAVFKAEGLGIL